VGSRRRGAAVLGYLADRGLPAERLDRVDVPAGLDLGHTTHQEIAVAILAELVRLRASGALAGAPPAATTAGGPAPAASPRTLSAGPGGSAEGNQRADPVCGMTVPATTAGYPLEHDGVTYYFCCAGCRRTFEQDPDRYATRETRC